MADRTDNIVAVKEGWIKGLEQDGAEDVDPDVGKKNDNDKGRSRNDLNNADTLKRKR